MKNYPTLILAIILFSNTINAQLKPVKYADGNQALNGLFIKAAKKSSNNPGILLLPAWLGIDNASKEIAEKLVVVVQFPISPRVNIAGIHSGAFVDLPAHHGQELAITLPSRVEKE